MAIVTTLVLLMALGLILTGLALALLQRDPVQARLAQLSQRPRSLEDLELEQPFSERVLRPLVQQLASAMQRLVRRRDPRQQERRISAVQQKLNLAGNPHRWTPNEFLGVKGLLALMVGALLFLLLTAVGQPGFAFLASAAGAAIGYTLPEMHLNSLIGQRQKEIQRVLPDALDLICISVEAGLGLDGALTHLCQKTDNALTREFARVLQEVRVGRPRREALREVIARTQVPDLANLIAAIIQAEQLGVSVSQVLAVQSEQMRTTRRQRAEEQAAQAPLKMLIPMMIFIFPALCIVILGPLWPQLASPNPIPR